MRPSRLVQPQAADDVARAVADFVRQRPETLVVNYHNITPGRFFEVWEPPIVHGLAWGRRQLRELRKTCGHGTVSDENEP